MSSVSNMIKKKMSLIIIFNNDNTSLLNIVYTFAPDFGVTIPHLRERDEKGIRCKS